MNMCDSGGSSSDDDCEFSDYYNIEGGCDVEQIDLKDTDPEYFEFECLSKGEVECLLSESVETLSNNLQIMPSQAKLYLHSHSWNFQEIVQKFGDPSQLTKANSPHSLDISIEKYCSVCLTVQDNSVFKSLTCGHSFCKDCWTKHFEVQISQGASTSISCMSQDCEVLVPEDLVQGLLHQTNLWQKYQQFAFKDYVRKHPQLRFCTGANCEVIIHSKEPKARRVTCVCGTNFCFNCGMDYHAPTDCDTIKKWLIKCADDSETANYLIVFTKSCPVCHICIEKKGGCNHMQCCRCSHEFCWMCMGDWKTHGSEYYECSRYKENPNIAQKSTQNEAKQALKRYLHYYERWENHAKSIKLEEETLLNIKSYINKKIMTGSGTWIDWQYLLDAGALLAKCRYTLQFTYPYAYFMELGPSKDLFEYQQAQLEAEIENLSWKIERAETTDRSDLENQMDIAEKRRVTLLLDFGADAGSSPSKNEERTELVSTVWC